MAEDDVSIMTKIKVGAPSRTSRAIQHEGHLSGPQSISSADDNKAVEAIHEPTNDNQAVVPVSEAANDNQAVVAVHTAADYSRAVVTAHGVANDNQTAATTHAAADDCTAIRVIDDLPRPLPVLPGEGEIVLKLLGERFRQILSGDTQ